MPQNIYSAEFKAEGVNLYEDHPEVSYAGAAADLGISRATLKNWVHQARKAAGKLPTRAPGAAPQQAENPRSPNSSEPGTG